MKSKARVGESGKLSQGKLRKKHVAGFFFAKQLKHILSFSILRSVVKSEAKTSEKQEKYIEFFFFSICLSEEIFGFPQFFVRREIKSNNLSTIYQWIFLSCVQKSQFIKKIFYLLLSSNLCRVKWNYSWFFPS